MKIVDTRPRVAYVEDTTRSWVENVGREGNLLKPQLIIRFATDTNYLSNYGNVPLYGDAPRAAQTLSMMNTTLPGQRLPHVLTWNVTEQGDTHVQTASIDAINALAVSERQTTLTSPLSGQLHDLTIRASYVANSLGVTEKVVGNTSVANHRDIDGYFFREENVQQRLFQNQTFSVSDASSFPNPAIPNDDDNDVPDDASWPAANDGAGAYYVLIDQEIVRVHQKSGNTFYIAPGGRAINGTLQAHGIGAPVKLLGFGPYRSGEWAGMGYLNTDDYRPQSAILRPGTCLVSYEGWGRIQGPLTHQYDASRNYTFTGYWFVTGTEPSISDDGTARIRIDLQSAGIMFDSQKITPHLIQRMKTRYGQWRIGEENQTIWGAADHTRNIPGDWVDFSSWDADLPGSYPLKINTEMAQHKEFMTHMNSTNMGVDCEFCQQEKKDWLKTHEDPATLQQRISGMPAGPARTALAKRQSDLALLLGRSVGRHVYKESIRVMQDEAGPIKTYIRLMATIAAAAWDHPAMGTELAQRFTKIPNKLFDNIRNVSTGLVYNGQIDFALDSSEVYYDFSTPTYEDVKIVSRRRDLTAPFSAVYDKAPFSQPMKDLADVNGNNFWMTREGYPVFVPRLFSYRPSGQGYRDLDRTVPFSAQGNEWFMSYGGSIQSYSHSLNVSQVLTQAIVTGVDAFEEAFPITVYAGGTGFRGLDRINYSPLAGNREGLALTGGQMQTDTVSLDNVVLGLDWNTNPANWGLSNEIKDNTVVVSALPPWYDGSPSRDSGDTGKSVERIQMLINFFLDRAYISPIYDGKKFWYSLTTDGKYNAATKEGVRKLQEYLWSKRAEPGMESLPTLTRDGKYTRNTYNWAHRWLVDSPSAGTEGVGEHYIKTDIFWYVNAGFTWDEYVAAITGIPVPFKKNTTTVKNPTQGADGLALSTPKWVIDEKGMQKEVATWHQKFAQMMINVGNRAVDDAINKATARSIQVSLADPRILPGDVIWCEIPGHLGSRNMKGELRPPFTNGIYVNSITRTMDLTTGTYTATYSGHRFRGVFNQGLSTSAINSGYDFIT